MESCKSFNVVDGIGEFHPDWVNCPKGGAGSTLISQYEPQGGSAKYSATGGPWTQVRWGTLLLCKASHRTVSRGGHIVYRQLHGWIPPPQVIYAVSARCSRIMRGRPFQRRLYSSARTDGKEHPMDNKKHIGMDVHQTSISIAVRDATGKLVVESPPSWNSSGACRELCGRRSKQGLAPLGCMTC